VSACTKEAGGNADDVGGTFPVHSVPRVRGYADNAIAFGLSDDAARCAKYDCSARLNPSLSQGACTILSWARRSQLNSGGPVGWPGAGWVDGGESGRGDVPDAAGAVGSDAGKVDDVVGLVVGATVVVLVLSERRVSAGAFFAVTSSVCIVPRVFELSDTMTMANTNAADKMINASHPARSAYAERGLFELTVGCCSPGWLSIALSESIAFREARTAVCCICRLVPSAPAMARLHDAHKTTVVIATENRDAPHVGLKAVRLFVGVG